MSLIFLAACANRTAYTGGVPNGGCYLIKDRKTCLTSLDGRPKTYKKEGLSVNGENCGWCWGEKCASGWGPHPSQNRCEPENWLKEKLNKNNGTDYEDCFQIKTGTYCH